VAPEPLLVLNRFDTEDEFDSALDELIDRGLLLFDRGQARYDLHPVVRQYAYNRLTEKAGVHARLRDYFANIPAPENARSLEELSPKIERFHHTLRSGQSDEALQLFLVRDGLRDVLYYHLGISALHRPIARFVP
jgi:hypothetical protein